MSLIFVTRRLLSVFSLGPRALVGPQRRPKLTPLTFAEVNRRRNEATGVGTDRTPCRCPDCRRSRQSRRRPASPPGLATTEGR